MEKNEELVEAGDEPINLVKIACELLRPIKRKILMVELHKLKLGCDETELELGYDRLGASKDEIEEITLATTLDAKVSKYESMGKMAINGRNYKVNQA